MHCILYTMYTLYIIQYTLPINQYTIIYYSKQCTYMYHKDLLLPYIHSVSRRLVKSLYISSGNRGLGSSLKNCFTTPATTLISASAASTSPLLVPGEEKRQVTRVGNYMSLKNN